MKYRIKLLWLVAVSALCMSVPSHATDGIHCSGVIKTVGVHGTDRVMLQLSGMNTIVQICHLNQTMGSTYPITSEQCRAAYSTLLTAYAMGKSVNVHFDNVQTGISCSTFVSWERATARWVRLED